MASNRDHKHQFPLKRLEALIKLATDFNLSLLEIGDVKIIPGPQRRQNFSDSNEKPKLIEEAEKRLGRELTAQEKQDEILFGPEGFIRND